MLLQPIDLVSQDVQLYLLRTDLLDPVTGGNKFFKLKYNIAEAGRLEHDTLLTFGGAYSNHIAATAASGKENDFRTIGIIRGEEERELNPTLKAALYNNMQLHFISRENYRIKDKKEFVNNLRELFGEFYLIPEGGSNVFAVKGCTEIRNYINMAFDYICCPVGTGGTLAGISASLKENEKALGFSSLQKGEFLEKKVQQLINEYHNHYSLKPQTSVSAFSITCDYAFGGYGKINDELVHFKKIMEEIHGIELDYVYTAKMMYGIFDLIKKKYFKPGSVIIAIHTGGIQGNKGFEKNTED